MTVRDEGSLMSPILIIGEAPGQQEMKAGVPFIGASGRTLNSWLHYAGLHRNRCYLTNVLDEMPPIRTGSLSDALKNGSVLRADIERGYLRLHRLISTMPNLKLIAPIGNYASYGVCGRGKVEWDKDAPGITQFRGSQYFYERHGRHIPVIPTIHPAAVMRQASWEKRCVSDWVRIAGVMNNGPTSPPIRDVVTSPTLADIQAWFQSVRTGATLAIDVESWRGRLEMVGVAKSTTEAIVIPTVPNYWGGQPKLDEVLAILHRYLSDPSIDKIFQNGLFDCWWLSKHTTVRGYHWDTMGMHHALDPMESHSLDFMASIYCNHYEYWKDEAKNAAEIMRYLDREGLERLYQYNALDCVHTYELFEKFFDLLLEDNMMQFYLRHYADMHGPLMRLSQGGILVNKTKMQQLYISHIEEAAKLRDDASQLAGRAMFRFDTTKCERAMLNFYEDCKLGVDRDWNLFECLEALIDQPGVTEQQIHAKWRQINDKTVSDHVLSDVLFKEWNAPQGKKTDKTFRDKLDDVNLRAVALKAQERARLPHKEQIVEMVDVVRRHRRQRKLASFLNVDRVSPDGRIHSEYRYITRSGRLSSRENPEGTGANLQNYDRTLKEIFTARPGCVLVEVDLSQAEGRVVKVLTGSPSMIELARREPWEGDEHRENAAFIFSVLLGVELTPEEVTDDQRQIGKRVVHAANYKMGKNRLVEVLLKEGYVRTPYETGKMLDVYYERNPYLDLYHNKVRRRMMQDERLETSWGRRVDFTGVRKDDELYKFGYSYVPQSEIGDLTNQYGLIYLDKFIRENKMESQIVLQVHDSIVVDCPPQEAYTIIQSLSNSLSRPRVYGQCFDLEVELSIPCEVSIGATRKTTHGWNYIPTEEQVNDAVDNILHLVT